MTHREETLINRVCVSCSKPLTGKQRLFCCDACRTRYNRQNDRKSTGLTAFDRELTANQPEINRFTNKRSYDVILTIRAESDFPPGEWDNGLITANIRAKIAEFAQEMLIYEHPGWTRVENTGESTVNYNELSDCLTRFFTSDNTIYLMRLLLCL